MKKFICLLLACILVFSLCGCGKNDVVDNKDGTQNVQDTIGSVTSDDNETSEPESESNIDDEYIENEDIGYKVGDYITFGSYEQDNNLGNGKEDIEWLILDVHDDKLFVISKYALDAHPYNTEYVEVTWETCTIRSWLNDEFFYSAFSELERENISTVTLNSANPVIDGDPGNDTQDKVFLISIEESYGYIELDGFINCIPTEYAISQGVNDVNLFGGFCWWRLRSHGSNQAYAAVVYPNDGIDCVGKKVSMDGAIRPAMWIEIA